jgi:hypothetical protein
MNARTTRLYERRGFTCQRQGTLPSSFVFPTALRFDLRRYADIQPTTAAPNAYG